MNQKPKIPPNLDHLVPGIEESVKMCLFLKHQYDFVDAETGSKPLSKLFFDVTFFHFAKQNALNLIVIELNKLFRENTSRSFYFSFKRLIEFVEKNQNILSKEQLQQIKALLDEAGDLKALDGEESLIKSLIVTRDKYLVHNDPDKYDHNSMHYVQQLFQLIEIAKKIVLILKGGAESDLALALSYSFPVSFGKTKLQEVTENFY